MFTVANGESIWSLLDRVSSWEEENYDGQLGTWRITHTSYLKQRFVQRLVQVNM